MYRFGEFILDEGERQLRGPDGPVELNARYFDALVLMLRAPGRLIEKDRFLAEVWSGVPVGDEALTQCIAALRRALGDSARAPRFIKTVPKHGYRFVAAVESADGRSEAPLPPAPSLRPAWLRIVALTAAGALGGAAAGVLGGLFYGGVIGFGPGAPAVGGASVLTLLVVLNVAVGAAGGFGVALGWAAGSLAGAGPLRPAAGAALGGFTVGALTSLLGLDAFTLLLGTTPVRMTGGLEGAVIGAAVALGLWAGGQMPRRNPVAAPIACATMACAIACMAIVLAGGTLLAGSLDGLGASIAASGAPMDRLAPFFAAVRFDGIREALLGGMEGLLFGAGLSAALVLTRRALETRKG